MPGSHWTGEDAGAGRQEPQQHRGQPLAETGDGGLRLKPRQHCEYLLSFKVSLRNQLATIITDSVVFINCLHI